jgi:hypothetical protein
MIPLNATDRGISIITILNDFARGNPCQIIAIYKARMAKESGVFWQGIAETITVGSEYPI